MLLSIYFMLTTTISFHVKTIRTISHIFVAFSQKLNFTVAVVSTKLYPDEIVKKCIIVYSHFRQGYVCSRAKRSGI